MLGIAVTRLGLVKVAPAVVAVEVVVVVVEAAVEAVVEAAVEALLAGIEVVTTV